MKRPEGKLQDELPELDLSSFSFDEFVQFLFDRKVVPENELIDYYRSDLQGNRFGGVDASSPIALIDHLTQLFSAFGQIAGKHSLTLVDQTVWGMIGPALNLPRYWFDSAVPLSKRLACIGSTYHVFGDYVSKHEGEFTPQLSGFYMWWDLVLDEFWLPPRKASPHGHDVSRLDEESRAVLGAIFETLTRILHLSDRESQKSALHGLGHLHHPGVRGVVQSFIDAKHPGFSLKWLEQCRDCGVL
jgi:hypothetical protein